MIMDNDNIFQLCGKERPEIQGTTQTNIAYVDDLPQVIANENKLSLQEYIQTLYKVTASFLADPPSGGVSSRFTLVRLCVCVSVLDEISL